MDKLPDDIQWQAYIMIILTEVVMLALLLFLNLDLKRDFSGKYARIVTLAVIGVALYDLMYYAALTFVDNYNSYSLF